MILLYFLSHIYIKPRHLVVFFQMLLQNMSTVKLLQYDHGTSLGLIPIHVSYLGKTTEIISSLKKLTILTWMHFQNLILPLKQLQFYSQKKKRHILNLVRVQISQKTQTKEPKQTSTILLIQPWTIFIYLQKRSLVSLTSYYVNLNLVLYHH